MYLIDISFQLPKKNRSKINKTKTSLLQTPEESE